jgi:glycosyltransferase involved in cell wall biosynthesis
VLISAYSCCPDWGSEPGVGWGRVTEIARYCDVWVLTNKNGMQPRIDAYLDKHGPIPNLEFVYIPRRRWELVVGARGLLKYVAYRSWLRRAFRVAQSLHAQVGFDIAHHITFTGFREPSYLYKLGIPFVWGPVGGAQNYPWRFLLGAGLSGAASEAMRSVLNVIQLHTSPRVRTATRSAAAIFTANPENKHKFREVLGAESILLSDGGTAIAGDSCRPRPSSDAIRILWTGNLATWKALELFIEALALLPDDVPYELRVIGEGPRRGQWQSLAERRGVSRNIQWWGRIPHEEALEQLRWADVFAFTSLRDTSGTVVLEALSAATPVICLDHQGVGAIVTAQCGIKIPVTNRRDVERRLSGAIAFLQRNRNQCRALAEGARRRATEYRWSLQAKRIAQEYNRILESAGSDSRCDLETPSDAANDFWHDAPVEDTTLQV